MKLTKSQAFKVPGLVDADATYAQLVDKLTELNHEQAVATHTADELAADIRSRPAPAINLEVAELLGQTVDKSLYERPRTLAGLRKRAADAETAASYVRKSIFDRRGPASSEVCRIIRPEYRARMQRFVDALLVADAAYKQIEELVDELDHEDVHASFLPAVAMPAFSKHNGAVDRFINEVRGAGHVQ
jgi:hypothetical protein